MADDLYRDPAMYGILSDLCGVREVDDRAPDTERIVQYLTCRGDRGATKPRMRDALGIERIDARLDDLRAAGHHLRTRVDDDTGLTIYVYAGYDPSAVRSYIHAGRWHRHALTGALEIRLMPTRMVGEYTPSQVDRLMRAIRQAIETWEAEEAREPPSCDDPDRLSLDDLLGGRWR